MKIKTLFAVLSLVCGVLFVSGCAQLRQRDMNRKPAVLAVLPFENFSNDVKGSEIPRKEIYKALLEEGYVVLDLENTDELLKEAGITDGGQLRAVDFAKLAEILGTRTFVKGDVKIYYQGMSFEILPLGLFYKREVKIEVSVVDALSGEIYFKKEKQLKDLKKVEEDKKSGFLENLADSAVKNALADTIYSGVEILSGELAKQLVSMMPYFYEN